MSLKIAISYLNISRLVSLKIAMLFLEFLGYVPTLVGETLIFFRDGSLRFAPGNPGKGCGA
jgi:hypothetical protein